MFIETDISKIFYDCHGVTIKPGDFLTTKDGRLYVTPSIGSTIGAVEVGENGVLSDNFVSFAAIAEDQELEDFQVTEFSLIKRAQEAGIISFSTSQNNEDIFGYFSKMYERAFEIANSSFTNRVFTFDIHFDDLIVSSVSEEGSVTWSVDDDDKTVYDIFTKSQSEREFIENISQYLIPRLAKFEPGKDIVID